LATVSEPAIRGSRQRSKRILTPTQTTKVAGTLRRAVSPAARTCSQVGVYFLVAIGLLGSQRVDIDPWQLDLIASATDGDYQPDR